MTSSAAHREHGDVPHDHVGVGHSHGDHTHGGHSHGSAGASRRALGTALALNGAFLVAELIGGAVFHSLALLADGVHMVSDVVALAIALFAARLAARPVSTRHTYGLGRAEVIAASVNAVALLGASVWIVVAAVGRFDAANSVRGGGVVVIGVLGLVVNLVSAAVLAREADGNLNVRAALWHMVSDALGSVAAIIAGVGALLGGPVWLDPVASIVVTVLVVVAAVRVLVDAVRVLLDAVPGHLDRDAVVASIAAVPGVGGVHHVHLWTIASGDVALSGHVLVDGSPTLHEAQHVATAVKRRLADQWGIAHATLEVECHPCDGPDLH